MQKRKRLRLAAIVSCLVVVVCMCIPTSSTKKVSAATKETVRIMPLGDSITDADYWRTMLYDKLMENEYSVKFVGSRGGHEGHWGMRVCDLAADKSLVKWLADYTPEIVMMHFGTNDCIKLTTSTEEILAAYTTLVEEMRAQNPHMIILVAKIIPLASYHTQYNKGVDALIAKVDEWARQMTTKESPITVVDQHSGFTDSDICDGIHPSYAGGQKMCDKWYEALAPILDGYENKIPVTPSESPVISETPVEPSEVPTESEIPAIQNTLNLTHSENVWSGGYSMKLELKNTSKEQVSNWKLVLKKADFDISDIWCAQVEETSDSYIITPLSWNQTILPGEFVSFGMLGTGTVNENFNYIIET